MDYNASTESVLKQFGEKEGSALAGAEDQRKSIEGLALAQKEQEEAAKKTAEEKNKAEEAKQKKKEEEERKQKPDSAESLLAQLNTNMTKLLAHAEQTTKNTYATYDATKGLNKNGFKA